MSTALHSWPKWPIAIARRGWHRWLPQFVWTDQDPPDHREAWWGPFNVSVRRMGTVVWPTHYRPALIVDIRLPFGLQFVMMLYRRWVRPRPMIKTVEAA